MRKAQETRGSKFTCEFGRNSTVYCFVASDNQYVYYEFQRNSFKHGISFDVSKGLLLPKKINSNIYRKKTRTLSPCLFWRFPSFASGRYTRTAPLTKNEIYLTFSKSDCVFKFYTHNSLWFDFGCVIAVVPFMNRL